MSPDSTSPLPEESLAWAGEEIEIQLRRHPDGLEKAELADLSGLSATQLRGGLQLLLDQDKLDEESDRLKLADPRARTPEPEPEEAAPPAPTEGQVELAAALPVPGAGPSYRVRYSVVTVFAGARGENRDEAARETAQQLEVKLAELVSEGLGVGVVVNLEALESFEPRPVSLDSGKQGP